VRVFDSGAIVPNPETFGEYKLTYRTGDIVSPHVEAAEPLCLEMTDFCEAIRGELEPESSAELGLEVVKMIEAVDASLEHDGTRIEVGTREWQAAAA
jgi:predicted dehydrogenase